MTDSKKSLAAFLVPSLTGVLLFMIPIQFQGRWTILVKILADAISGALGALLPILCLCLLTISSIGAVMALAGYAPMHNNALLRECFVCTPVWVLVRALGCLFAWLTYLGIGQGPLAMIAGADQGGVALDLITGLVVIFAIASFLLPLLLDFGLLEFIGALLTRYMRPVFHVPGRAAVDCITSWIGDGTLGVMLTCNQYEGGYYSAKEACIIATTFSAVSITFSLVVLDQVGLLEYFGIYYLLICFVGIVCAILCPRIPPLSLKKDSFLVPGHAMSEALPEGFTSARQFGLSLARSRASEHNGAGEFFSSGMKNCASMWFGVLPTVMCIGTVALILANFTPLFRLLGIPFIPLLKLLGVPEATEASATLIVGFADMFTPTVIISAAGVSAQTRFIVAVISVTQVLFLDEVGGLILASKLPITLPELFLIFLERTMISLVIVCPISHLLF